MKWLFVVATILIVVTAYVYIKPEKLQIIFSVFGLVQNQASSDKMGSIYKIEHLNDTTSVNTVAGTLSLEKHNDSDDMPVYTLGGKRLLESYYGSVSLVEKIDSDAETIIVANGANGNAEEGSEIVSITRDGSHHDLSKSFGDNSYATPKISTDGKKVIFEFETSEKYMTGQEIWSYEHGTLSGPTKNIKLKYDFDVNTLLKLKGGVSQKIEGKIVVDENGDLVLKTKNRLIEPCNEEVEDTFTFEADIAPPKKDSEGIFNTVIECNGSRAENFGPKITAINIPFAGSFAIKNIRLGMTFEELGPFIASKSIYCPEGKGSEVGIQDVRLCFMSQSWGYGPPKNHLELADSVAGRSIDAISLLFFKKLLYAAMIKLDWGNERQIIDVAEALAGKFGDHADKLAKVKGMDIPPAFSSYTFEEGGRAYHTSMWASTNGQLLFYGASTVYPIESFEMGRNIKEDSRRSFSTYGGRYNPNNVPRSVIITMVDPATVEMIATRAEKDEQESNEKNLQESMQKNMDELTKMREQAKQDALSL